MLAIGAQKLDVGAQDFFIDTTLFLRTLDGADIYVEMKGQMVSATEQLAHMHSKFQTVHPGYAWLNPIAAVGILSPTGWGYSLDMWQVLSPPK